MATLDTTPRPAGERDFTRRDRPDPAFEAGLRDLMLLTMGHLTPALLAGADGRDRRERLYAAAESLAARPAHADLRRALIAGLQGRARDARRAIDGRGERAGRSSLRAAASDPGVMAYVFVLGRLHNRVLEAEVVRLQRQDRSLDEATARDIVDSAFTRVVLSPSSDLTRGTGVIAATIHHERLSHYRRAGRHRAVRLEGPEHARSDGWPVAKEPSRDDLASRQTVAVLLRIASGLPGKYGTAIMALIASDGRSGIAAVARSLDISVSAAKRLTRAVRAEFRRRAEQDPDAVDAILAMPPAGPAPRRRRARGNLRRRVPASERGGTQS